MAYIGLAPFSNFLTTSSQKFSGNSVANTKQFIMGRSVSKAEDIEVFVGNVQSLPPDYTAQGTELTFATAPATGTNNITVIFRAGALQSLDVSRTGNPAGTVSAPSLYFTGATNTGIYWPSTTKVAVATSGTDRIIVDDASTSTSTTTGALQVVGGVGATGNLNVGGLVRITNTTQSTTGGSGALVISGGLGVAKNLNVNGSLAVTGDFTVAGTTTTTGAASLAISDPFVFLATNNTGDTIDQGFIGKYVESTVTRYSGIFRDATDGVFKFFGNLTAIPTTTVDIGNVSFQYSPLTAAAITSTGILSASSGTSASSTTTGALQVSGGAGVSGALYAGSIVTAGAITATGSIGNVTSVTAGGTIQTTGMVWANANIISTTQTTGAVVINSWGGLGVGGNLNIGTAGTVAGQNTTHTIAGNVTPTISNVFTLGSTTRWWLQTYSVASTAQYADLAENYTADEAYEPGTVLDFGGDAEVTVCDVDMSTRVAGVVSTNPAYLMNGALNAPTVVSLALIGRVPCKVVGPIKKGDMLVSAGAGRARAEHIPQMGSVIGKALENFNGESGIIEVVVGKL